MKILIADDELRLRKVVAMFLKKSGHEVIEVSDGEQAVKAAAEHQPDVIILDMEMPGIGGIEACKLIKSDDNTQSIPVIMLTANVSPEDRAKGAEAGAQDYVTKPFSPKDLLEKIILITGEQ